MIRIRVRVTGPPTLFTYRINLFFRAGSPVLAGKEASKVGFGSMSLTAAGFGGVRWVGWSGSQTHRKLRFCGL